MLITKKMFKLSMFYFETKLLDYKKFLQNGKLYMHEVHMKRSTHLQPCVFKPLGTLISAIAGQNDTFSLSLPFPVQCWRYALKSFSTKSALLKGEGDSRKRLLQQHFQTFIRSKIRVCSAKCVFTPHFYKHPKTFWPACRYATFAHVNDGKHFSNVLIDITRQRQFVWDC